MMPSIRIPIWLQLAVAVAMIILVIVLTLSFGMLKRQENQLYDQSVRIGMVSLNYFANNASIPLLENNIVGLNSLLKESTSVEGILYAFILDNQGIIQAHSNVNRIGKPYEPVSKKQNLIQENVITHFNYDLPSGENVLNLIRPVEFRDKQLGEVHVGVSMDFIEDVIQQETKTIVNMTLLILFAGILVAVFLGIYFSDPILRLVEATGEISRGNFKHKVHLRRKDEFGNLAKAFNHMSDELWAKSLMKESFGKYVGREILELILKSPEQNWLKGKKNEATVVLADIRGFTAYSEHTPPEKVVEELNEYFEIATDIIQKHKGYVDKFIGDALLGVFGVPVYYDDHEKKALRACMEMQKMFRKTAGKKGNRLLNCVGISVNAGLVVSGNIGSQSKMEYTVIGDTVNMASRMNTLAKANEVIISKAIFEKLKNNLYTAALPPAVIKGKSELIQTYKVLAFHE